MEKRKIGLDDTNAICLCIVRLEKNADIIYRGALTNWGSFSPRDDTILTRIQTIHFNCICMHNLLVLFALPWCWLRLRQARSQKSTVISIKNVWFV